MAKEAGGLTKNQTGPGFVDKVVSKLCQEPDFLLSLNSVVLMSECDWDRFGNRIYFLSDPGLVDILWDARMDLLPEDLQGFPRSFSIAFPAGSSPSGVELPGCLVWWGTYHDRKDTAARFSSRYLGGGRVELVDPAWMSRTAPRAPNHERILRIAYTIGSGENAQSVLVAIPESFIAKCLKSEDGMESIGTFDDVPCRCPSRGMSGAFSTPSPAWPCT